MKRTIKTNKLYVGFGIRNTFFILLLCGLFVSSCDDLKKEEDAEKAAAEMCDCLKKYSTNTCKQNLNKKYGHYANDDEFINMFNNAQDCGVTIYKE